MPSRCEPHYAACPHPPSIVRCCSWPPWRRSESACAAAASCCGSRHPLLTGSRWRFRWLPWTRRSPLAGDGRVAGPKHHPRHRRPRRRGRHPRLRHEVLRRPTPTHRPRVQSTWTGRPRLNWSVCRAAGRRWRRVSWPIAQSTDPSAPSRVCSASKASVPGCRERCNHMSRFRFRLVLPTRARPLRARSGVLDLATAGRDASISIVCLLRHSVWTRGLPFAQQ